MKWGEDARYLDGEPMGKNRARFADVLAIAVILLAIALIVGWLS